MTEFEEIQAALRELDDDELQTRIVRREQRDETFAEARVPTELLLAEIRRRGLD